MNRNRHNALSLAVVLLALVLLVAGVLGLFRLRFEQGDFYPAYSSLRADPVGTRALYESLGRLPGIQLERSFLPLGELDVSDPGTLFVIGCSPGYLGWRPEADYDRLNLWMSTGGRVVVALNPRSGLIQRASDRVERELQTGEMDPEADDEDEAGETPPEETEASPADSGAADDPDDEEDTPVWLREVEMPWGLGMDRPVPEDLFPHAHLDEDAGESEPEVSLALPEEGVDAGAMTWHGRVVFEPEDPAWQVRYRYRDQPVVVERKVGRGRLVLLADAWPFSNEALLMERHPDLLAGLVGPHRRVVFSEQHLMIRQNRGVMLLMREYHLEGLLLSLVVLAALYIWKELVPWMPVRETTEHPDAVEGKDTQSGFINLLRRNIPPRRLVSTCVDEWEKAADLHGRARGDRRTEIRQLLEQEGPGGTRPGPVTLYNRIRGITLQRK